MDIDDLIEELQVLFDKFPNDTHWLFAADGVLHILRRGDFARRRLTENGCMDQSAIVASVRGPEIDGGDW